MGYFVELVSGPTWSYAYAGTRRPIIREIRLTIEGSLPSEDLEVFPRVSFNFPLPEKVAEVWQGATRVIPIRGPSVGNPVVWDQVNLQLNLALISRLLEHATGELVLDVVDSKTGLVVASTRQRLTLLPFNIFLWEYEYHDSLAAFVLPSDPFVSNVLDAARQILKANTGDSSTDGYQSYNYSPVEAAKSRVRMIVKSIYEAIQTFGLSYSNPPAELLTIGQRVRTPTQVREERCATCLDSTVLMAACLEQVGISSALVLIRGHAFVGYFTGLPHQLDPTKVLVGTHSVGFWRRQIASCTSSGVLRGSDHNQLLTHLLVHQAIQPIETTTLTSGLLRSFDEACLKQNGFTVTENIGDVQSIVTPTLAWRAGVTPPVLLSKTSSPTLVEQTLDSPAAIGDDSSQPDRSIAETDVLDYAERDEETPPRVRQWKASLLDLGGNNPLLKVKKRALKIDFPSLLIGALDDRLYTPKAKIPIVSFADIPLDWIQNGVTEPQYAAWLNTSLQLLTPSFRDIPGLHREVSRLTEEILKRGYATSEVIAHQKAFEIVLSNARDDLRKQISRLQSAARERFLQTGVNSLYLTLGSLSWRERETNQRGQTKEIQWLAPLYLYPIIIEGGRGAPYTVRLDPQGEVTPNYCLHEKLRRLQVEVPELIEPLEDEKGLDLNRMLNSISGRLQQSKKTNFAVRPDVHIDVFDFATFRLWMDLDDHWESMAEISPVARHLMLTPNQPFPEQQRHSASRFRALTPIPADDSQQDAIELALNGTSFRLEGPPGTGKSQTITNLLASCLAYKKKILFVAEKQTALDAVKKRLDACGLGDFCLNLHAKGDSDTRLRKNITEAITTAQSKDLDPQDQRWEDLQFAMTNEERLLDAYRDALHTVDGTAESLWTVNELLLEIGSGDLIELPSSFTSQFFELWPRFRGAIQGVIEALEVSGDPRASRWRWVESICDDSRSLEDLSKSLETLLSSYRRCAAESATTLASLDKLDQRQCVLLADYLDLVKSGWAPLISTIETLDFGVLPSYQEALKSGTAFDRAGFSLINDCQVLNSEFDNVSSFIEPSVIRTENFGLSLEVLLTIDRLLDSASDLSRLFQKWQTLQAAVEQSQTPILVDLLGERNPDRIRVLQQEFVESKAEDAITRLQLDCSRLQSEVREHFTNVAPEFLARDDLVKIDMLVNDLESASIFNRGRRTRALRDSLGVHALATDDRLLLVSLKALREVSAKSQDLVVRTRSMFPDLTPIDWQPWNSTDCAQLWDTVAKRQIEKLRNDLGVQSLPGSREEVNRVINETLRLLEMSRDCRNSQTTDELKIDLFDYRPWLPTEAERLRKMVVATKMLSVRRILGSAAKTMDDDALRRAIRHLSKIASRSVEIEGRIKTSLLPGSTADIRLWEIESIRYIESATRICGELKQVLADPIAGEAVKLLVALSASAGDNTQIREIANGWHHLFKTVRIDSRFEREWRSDSLSGSVLANFPELLRDAGPNHSFVELRRLLNTRIKLDEVAAMGLSTVSDLIFYDSLHPAQVLESVRRSALTSYFKSLLIETNLDRFDRRIHERRIATFEAALKESQRLLKIRIPGMVAQRQKKRATLSGKEAGATQSLLRGLKPGRGERTPIRELISRYGRALSDSLPCFLMSPDSVARLLPVGAVDFDLVVFDEASQIRVSHAIGAIGRAKACVVVGDSKQMPPSRSFSSNQGVFITDDTDAHSESLDDEPSEESDKIDSNSDDSSAMTQWQSAEDMESILEEFAESGFPYRQLLCHYRSRDEVLIAFSNREIYEQPMITFPSIYGDESLALRFVHVPEGHFERSKDAMPYDLGGIKISALRTNRVEADAVVEEVLARLKDERRRMRWLADKSGEAESIIVITFNIQQMKLITALLEDADSAAYNEAIQEGEADEVTGARRQPRLKIRNLENVQGDEADTVIFSVAFSKTPNGKFPLNWGPVTQPKGDRRLNVAVTRARFEMLVFCSFKPEEMIFGRNKEDLSIETQRVHSFLQIACDGPARLRNLAIDTRTSQQIEVIAGAIRARGYRVRVQEGLSQLRVDLAVSRKDCDHSELAILVDDCAWRDRGSAFQRDLLPLQVLPGLGWKKVMRIWLPAWVNEREAVLDEIEQFFGQLHTNSLEQSPGESPDELLEEAIDRSGKQPLPEQNNHEIASRHIPFQPYVPTVIGSADWLDNAAKTRSAQTRLLVLIQEIINKESPIEIKRLGRLVGNSLGLSRVTTDRIDQIRRNVPKEQRVKDVVGEFCWARGVDPEQWSSFRTSLDDSERHRKIEEICVREIGNALVDLLERVQKVSKNDAIRELANIFGFRAVSDKTADALESAIEASLLRGRVRIIDGDFELPG